MGRLVKDANPVDGVRSYGLRRDKYARAPVEDQSIWSYRTTKRPRTGSDTGPAIRVAAVTRTELHALPGWNSAFACLPKDHRYHEIVEDTLHPEFVYKYLVITAETGLVLAVQPFFVLDQDLIEGTGGRIKSAVCFIRKYWPKFLTMRTLMLGCVAGEGHLDDRGAFANPAVVHALANGALEAANTERAGLVVLKEFTSSYRRSLLPLKDRDFVKLPSLPMASLDINYKNFDDYMAKRLSAATRKDLRRKFKASANASLKLDVTTDISDVIDEIYPLYVNVYNRSTLHFEKLTKDYLLELSRRMPDRVRFFIWRTEGRIVAFNLCLVHGDSIYDQYIGLDYQVALDLHLYHYTFRDIVNWAISNGYKRYRTAGLNYDPKLRLKMQLDPLDLYVRHRSGTLNAILKLMLPWLEPTQNDPHLKRFANYTDLKAEV